ncbi:dihydroneopterin aldolase [Aliiroseovarius sp. Z3]|uniref:dihydroneopterin aldolase n=1 Tax=Aliiroseovarius sp. Z3 TaxID=2811402 RepID=UPI0023B2A434|nr:dihydroneopterin aldolase [Aliiroseovarius sp. Z3]MDE9450825.1 dihydroneopterin aldolase [Aliiroseovarius sp. Z3]
MTDETAAAFGSLDRRAASQGSQTPAPDRISVRDHVVEVEIGAFQSERDTTQRLSFSVVVEVTSSDGAQTDDVDDILSYDAITEAITAELAAERLNLLETLAERIAERILAEPQPLRVFVRIEKLDRGPGKLGVEIVRTRDTEPSRRDASAVPALNVIYLENDAFTDPELPRFLDRLGADPRAFVLCVGPADTHAMQVADKNAQRHINLLEIEQNAWRLSAIDKRCVVVGTRTELDWGIKNNQISLWAPSKLVLDAVDGPPDDAPHKLTRWFADVMGAEAVVCIGRGQCELAELP